MDERFAIEYIFQLNVALGILYVGLSKFRFRENLYDTIVERVNFHGYLEMPFDDVASDLLHNTGFSDSHKYIQSVVALLPEEYLGSLKGNKNRLSSEEDEDDPPPPPPLYCRFTEDRDKYIVGAFNIGASLLALWILCFLRIPPPSEASLFGWILIVLFVLLALLGQCVFGFYVHTGRRMAQEVREELNKSLKNAEEKIGKAQAKLEKPSDDPPSFVDDLPF